MRDVRSRSTSNRDIQLTTENPGSPVSTESKVILLGGGLFFLTSLMGAWVAYDGIAAGLRLLSITLGIMTIPGLIWTVRIWGRTALGAAAVAVALLAGVVSLGHALGPGLTGEMVVGAELALIPIGVGGVVWSYRRRMTGMAVIAGAGVLLAMLSFMTAGERSAWLAIIVGGITAGIAYWRTGAGRASAWRWFVGIALIASALLILALFWSSLRSTELGVWLVRNLGGSAASRLLIWRDAVTLIGDYIFTGSGLDTVPMVLSSYAFLYHVPFLYHAHNIYLQMALEQGIFTLIAFAILILGSIRALWRPFDRRGVTLHWIWVGTGTALIALLLYGLMDAGFYATPLVFTTFLPFAFAAGLSQMRKAPAAANASSRSGFPAYGWVAVTIGIVIMGAAFLAFNWRQTVVARLVNLGAIAQTQTELSVYEWPQWSIQDEVRNSPDVADLTTALERYGAAIDLSPTNATANRRLGQILLSQGDYEAATRHLEQALVSSPRDRITQQLLGEAYAVTGNVEQAAELWRAVAPDQEKLRDRYWWYDHIGAAQEAKWMAQAIALTKLSSGSGSTK